LALGGSVSALRTSTDLNYAKGTKAVWLVVLTSQGELRIDRHPVQKQPLQFAPKLMKGEAKAVRDREDVRDNLRNPAGSKTTAEWVAWQKQREEQRAKEMADYEVRRKLVREIAGLFAKADGLNDQSWQRFLGENAEVRLSVCQLSEHEQPMDGVRFAEFVRGVLEREKDEHIRTHAVCRLGYSRDSGVKGAETLSAALRDPSADVRMYACQSVKQRRYESLTAQVKSLAKDADPKVREMAKDTLKYWSETPAK
jgi:HEAT repeats